MQPAPEIDAHVETEVAKARQILDHLSADNVVASPYLVSAVYYHDGFLSGFPVDRRTADPERRIIGRIGDSLSPESKAHFVQMLHEMWAKSEPPGPAEWAAPVAYSASSGGRRSHKYAIDLFAREGAAIHAVTRGIVVLADRDWSPDDLFSTTSRKGGNTVIVFDADHDRFYRYCHMSTVQVSSGDFVSAGQVIGTVGHSGLNAAQPGHGRHLHFEANEYRQGRVHAMDYRGLRTLLRRRGSLSGPAAGGNSAPGQTRRAALEARSNR
ncbi:MAG TPA: M23 family metallopeptidase [Candidatus Sulfopaludibacter sp.]|nr:M23 family metallopeptidase [Candidatus Sulfopaludibacter sp.]